MRSGDVIANRRAKVLELYQQGLKTREIAQALGRWHWRTIENDISYIQKGAVFDAPDWFEEARVTALESIDDMKNLRDMAYELLDGDKKMSTPTRVQVMRLIADVDAKLADKLLPSQAIIQSVGAEKIEFSWKGDTPLCTKCGRHHQPNEPCESVILTSE